MSYKGLTSVLEVGRKCRQNTTFRHASNAQTKETAANRNKLAQLKATITSANRFLHLRESWCRTRFLHRYFRSTFSIYPKRYFHGSCVHMCQDNENGKDNKGTELSNQTDADSNEDMNESHSTWTTDTINNTNGEDEESKAEKVYTSMDNNQETILNQHLPDLNQNNKGYSHGHLPVLSDEVYTALESTKSVHENGCFSEKYLADYLTEKDMKFVVGQTCHYTVCPKWGKLAMKSLKEKDRLFINSTTGYFTCNACGKNGEWNRLKDNIEWLRSMKINKKLECFKNVMDVYCEVSETPPTLTKLLEDTKEFTTISDEQLDNIHSLFDWQGLEKWTFIQYGVRYKITGDEYNVYIPVINTRGATVAVTHWSGCITDDGEVKTYPVRTYPRKYGFKDSTDLFGWHVRPKRRRGSLHREIVITTSELHVMAIFQETGVMAIALKTPFHLPQEILPYLEEFDKIVLWLGTDIKSWDLAKAFAKKLSDKRCYNFRPNVLKYMPMEALQSGECVQSILECACLIRHKAILQFDAIRNEVYSEFAHVEQVAGIQWQRYRKLNHLLKGHRRGELTVLTGPTGSGKTTFVSDYALDLCMQGVSTLWGSFEITNVRLTKIMMQQFSGMNLSKHIDQFDEVADKYSQLPMYFMRYFSQADLDQILEAMAHAVYVHDISHVVIDNLQFMLGMNFTEKNRFFKQDQAIAAFRKFATEKNCHVTLIIHPRKMEEGEELSTSSIFGSAKVSQEADTVMLIQDQRLTRPKGKKYIQITKNRFDGDLGVMVLTFNKESLRFFEAQEKKPRQPEDEDGDMPE